MRIRASVRVGNLRKVFRSDSGDELSTLVARLAVLYEDLRIEAYGVATRRRIRALDMIDARSRRLYFSRRSILTLLEFSEALHDLEECPGFGPIKARFGAEYLPVWNAAIAFFQKRHRFLEKVRNDIGGHFGRKAAQHAVKNINPTVIGKIEIVVHKSGKGGGSKLHFASEIAATAMLHHVPGKDSKEKVEFLIRDTVKEGFGHATGATHLVVARYLWERFGR